MEYVYHIGVVISLYVILSVSFNITIGLAGLFALAHASFYAFGAYAAAILSVKLGIGFPLSMLVGIVGAGVVGMIIALPALRVGGHYLVIITLAFQAIVTDFLRNANGLTGGPDGLAGVEPINLFGADLTTPGDFLPLAVFFAVLVYLIGQRLERSPFGRALRAMREDESAVQSVGKNPVAFKLLAFAVSGGLAAIAGSLFAHYVSYVGPHSFTVEETILILTMVILGGIGNLTGSVVGAIILVLLPEALKLLSLPPITADMLRGCIYGAMLIVILRFRPQGLLPERHSIPKIADSLRAELKAVGKTVFDIAKVAASGPTLVGKGLHKRFGGIVAVDDATITLKAGRVTGLIGPNGAGKTTAFNLLTGFISTNSGEVTFRDESIGGLRPHEIVSSGIARSFQDLRLFRSMTVLENVLVALPHQAGDKLLNVFFRPRLVRHQEAENLLKAEAVLAYVGLREKAMERADNLSYAEEKLLVIARLVATGAEVLLLDEPLSGLDPTTLEQILPSIRRLAEEGRTVCLIEHNLDVIQKVCDYAFYLDEGRVLAEGPPNELMQDPELQGRYFR
ncbi:ABC transporter permease subunit [Roseovarius amoyensis]|uniref:branched-chain amino acid ABC transporter ATP-binding protein/permease n=1 Tax=Roseovarius amoyensis TaxID=2211448 RepID=UPI000DBE5E88|nr:branched-chain amino acid ABC transporter ATP-binding protein/permease [Roseovarius amoyensis]